MDMGRVDRGGTGVVRVSGPVVITGIGCSEQQPLSIAWGVKRRHMRKSPVWSPPSVPSRGGVAAAARDGLWAQEVEMLPCLRLSHTTAYHWCPVCAV